MKVDHKNIKNSKNHLKIAVIIPNDFSVVWFCEVLVKNLMNNNEVRKVGVEWSINQTKELIEYGAPCIHFYTMGKSDNIQKIVSNFA